MEDLQQKALTILIPVYNDWESLNLLIGQIDQTLDRSNLSSVSILVINDGSSLEHQIHQQQVSQLQKIDTIKILHLSCNMGSQRSIAIGIAYLANYAQSDLVVVMDSDGEDKPEYISELLSKNRMVPENIIVAERSKRSETLLFRFMYRIYKYLFLYLTGQRISFGNFCLIPAVQLTRLASRSELWINLPATIIRSRLPIDKIPTNRGERLLGKSSMNFSGLILHGLSAISVYSDSTLVRILLIFSCSSVCILSLTFLFGALFNPFSGSALIYFVILLLLFFISVQSTIITLLLIFQLISNWAQSPIIPNNSYSDYIWFEEEF